MIKVKRSTTPPALDLSDPQSDASKELQKIWNQVDDLKSRGVLPQDYPSFKFSAYKKTGVKDELRNMFHGKCAYCETPIAGSQDTDIEHYRPKGRVAGAQDHPGYWWVAMAWTNLVLSCSHCNQRRRQQLVDKNGNVHAEATMGKLDQFPLANEASRVFAPPQVMFNANLDQQTHNAENALVIDPCRMDPDEHLEWVLLNHVAVLRPKATPQGVSEVGKATCKVLALNRRWLEEQRRRLFRIMKLQEVLIIWAMKIWDKADQEADEDGRAMASKMVLLCYDSLKSMAEPSQPFSGMARAYIQNLNERLF